jgi:hypothetical protein
LCAGWLGVGCHCSNSYHHRDADVLESDTDKEQPQRTDTAEGPGAVDEFVECVEQNDTELIVVVDESIAIDVAEPIVESIVNIIADQLVDAAAVPALAERSAVHVVLKRRDGVEDRVQTGAERRQVILDARRHFREADLLQHAISHEL